MTVSNAKKNVIFFFFVLLETWIVGTCQNRLGMKKMDTHVKPGLTVYKSGVREGINNTGVLSLCRKTSLHVGSFS